MLYDYIVEKTVNNQDFKQRFYMITVVSLELYRMLVSTLLILFVPQNCYDHLCSINENLIWEYPLYDIGLTFNFITLFAFVILYGIEIIRENRMISYLEVNPENPLDNKSLITIFEKLSKKYQEKIYSIDSIYQKTSYICIFIFIINTILSGIVIYDYNYDNQTTTTFITNVLFMTNKIYYRYYIANTDKSIFYSAYMQNFVQYNDIDPKIKIDIEKCDRELTTPQHYVQPHDITNNLEEKYTMIFCTNEDNGWYNLRESSNEENIETSVEQEDINQKQMEKEDINQTEENDIKPSKPEISKNHNEYENKMEKELYFSLGIPLELPIENIEISIDNTSSEIPDKIGHEYSVLPNTDIIKYYGKL